MELQSQYSHVSEHSGVEKGEHIFRKEALLVEIQQDRSGLAGLWLPEAQMRCWLAQFLCDLRL